MGSFCLFFYIILLFLFDFFKKKNKSLKPIDSIILVTSLTG